MNRIVVFFAGIFLMFFGFIGAALADLNIFIGDLNTQARSNRYDYSYRMSNQFGMPINRVDSILSGVREPADAFMCFQLGRMLGIPPERVFETYQSSRGQGWGEIAKRLGIKPGSPEFHALKNGNFSFTGKPGQGHSSNKSGGYPIYDDHGHGHGKGKYQDKKMKGYDDTYPGEGHGKGKGKGHNK
jgi:hypothetical protein